MQCAQFPFFVDFLREFFVSIWPSKCVQISISGAVALCQANRPVFAVGADVDTGTDRLVKLPYLTVRQFYTYYSHGKTFRESPESSDSLLTLYRALKVVKRLTFLCIVNLMSQNVWSFLRMQHEALLGSFWIEIAILGTFWIEIAFLETLWIKITILETFWIEIAFLGTLWIEIVILGTFWIQIAFLGALWIEIAFLGTL
jgi:hypothetical protein